MAWAAGIAVRPVIWTVLPPVSSCYRLLVGSGKTINLRRLTRILDGCACALAGSAEPGEEDGSTGTRACGITSRFLAAARLRIATAAGSAWRTCAVALTRRAAASESVIGPADT